MYLYTVSSWDYESIDSEIHLLHQNSFPEKVFKAHLQTCLEEIEPIENSSILSSDKGMYAESVYRWEDGTIQQLCDKMVENFGYEYPENEFKFTKATFSKFSTI